MATTETTDNLSNRLTKEHGFRIENNVLIGKEVDRPINYTSLGKFVLDKLENNPYIVGQIDAVTGQQDRYEQMRDRSVRCALWMKSHGIQQNDVVAVCSYNHVDVVIPCYAALYLGAAFNPLDIAMTTTELSHMLKITRPKMAFVTEQSALVISRAAKYADIDLKIVVFGYVYGYEDFSDIIKQPTDHRVKTFQCTEIENPSATAYIGCSSGTTSLPKVVAHSHRAILKNVCALDDLDLSGKTFLVFSPLYWVSGTQFLFSSLSSKVTRIVAASFEERFACALIQKYKVSWMFLNATLVNRLVRFNGLYKYDLTSVKSILTDGELIASVPPKVFEYHLPNATIALVYGLSEIGGNATKMIPHQKPGSSGIVCDNMQIRFVDPSTGKSLGPHQKGEIQVKTPYVVECYRGNPIISSQLVDNEGWLHTGDIGYYDEEGEIFVIDRIRELINYRGFYISPSEIEGLIYTHPDVMEVAVVGVPTLLDKEHPIAFVVKTRNSTVTEKDLVDLVAKKLTDAKQLRGGVKFIDRMPKTPSGKISRRDVRELSNEILYDRRNCDCRYEEFREVCARIFAKWMIVLWCKTAPESGYYLLSTRILDGHFDGSSLPVLSRLEQAPVTSPNEFCGPDSQLEWVRTSWNSMRMKWYAKLPVLFVENETSESRRWENNVLIGKEVIPDHGYTSLGKFVLDALEKDPQLVGQIDAITGESETFARMRDRSVRCALWMKNHGFRQNDVVTICSHNHLDVAMPCFAASYLGIPFNALDIGMGIQDMNHMMSITRSKLAFASQDSAPVIAKAAREAKIQLRIVVFGEMTGFDNFSHIIEEASIDEVRAFQCAKIENPNAIAIIACSSGTTGMPKGVALSHKTMLDNLYVKDAYRLVGKNFVTFTSIYWISGVMFLYSTASMKMTRIVASTFEEDVACSIVEKYKVFGIFLNAVQIIRLSKFNGIDEYDLSSLRSVITGGQPVTPRIQKILSDRFPNATVTSIYGLTEIGGNATTMVPGQKFGSSGVVKNNAQLRIIDPDSGRVLGPNEKGEIHLKISSKLEYYYGNPEALADLVDAEDWLHTGDIGYYDEDGEVFVVDRIKEVMKYRSFHVSPGEIEALLYEHPGVVEVAVSSVPHPTDVEHPIALVVRSENFKVTAEELIDLVAAKLSDYKQLRGGVKFIDHIPKTPSGKISRREVRELAKYLTVQS